MIRPATTNDYPLLITLWEASVRATHHFLPEDYLQFIKSILPRAFSHVQLYVYVQTDKTITGFAGVDEDKIEMLFIDPAMRGKGVGRTLITFCMQQLGANKVDVNEQNQQAVEFYQHIGFVVTGRSELDGAGQPFPLLHMQTASSFNQ